MMTVNADLIRKVMAHIREHPEQWDQEWWDSRFADKATCGTPRCFGGWVLVFGGRTDLLDAWIGWHPNGTTGWHRDGKMPEEDLGTVAADLLGLKREQADALFFSGFRDTIDEYEARVTRVTGVTFGDKT